MERALAPNIRSPVPEHRFATLKLLACNPMPSDDHSPPNPQTQHEEDLYELNEDGQLHSSQPKHARRYKDGSSIDWHHEEAVERERTQRLRSQAGARGLVLPLIEASKLWFVVILTGMGIGITGAWLDVLVKWCVFAYLFIL